MALLNLRRLHFSPLASPFAANRSDIATDSDILENRLLYPLHRIAAGEAGNDFGGFSSGTQAARPHL
jgi:hypothetical protein